MTGGNSEISPTEQAPASQPGAIHPAVIDAGPPAGSADTARPGPSALRVRPTRVAGTWVGVLAAAILLVLLLVFILENSRSVKVSFMGASGHLPLGVALLFAAVGGALLVGIVGVARLGQLRLTARRLRRARGRTIKHPRPD